MENQEVIGERQHGLPNCREVGEWMREALSRKTYWVLVDEMLSMTQLCSVFSAKLMLSGML